MTRRALPARLAFAIPIALAEGDAPVWVQILATGTWKHPRYGDMAIAPADLKELKANFDAGARDFVYADYDHGVATPRGDGNAIVSGEVKALELRANDAELWALYEPTAPAKQKLANREYRYTSADFLTDYRDKQTGKRWGKVLRGFALTNTPFIEGMARLTLGDALTGGACPHHLLAEYPEEAPASEIPMPIKTKLKLAETATDAEVEAAVDKLLADAAQATTLSESAQASATVLTEVRAALHLAEGADGAAVAAAVTALATKTATLEQTRRETAADKLLSDLVAQGKVAPAERAALRADLLSENADVAAATKRQLEARPKIVPVGERKADPAGGTAIETDPDKLLDEKIKELRKADKALTYRDALILAEQQLDAATAE